MSAFAPVQPLPTTQQSFLVREYRKLLRKRKRSSSDEDEDNDAEREASADVVKSESDHDSDDSNISSTSDNDGRRLSQAVNRKDPYYVAGHPRSKPLPGGSFPHAAAATTFTFTASRQPATAVLEERLADLDLFLPKSLLSDQALSLKGRHLGNLTALLHQCMLKEDWSRANRVWALLLRIESGGQGIDVRKHGRWTIGAELLMQGHRSTHSSSSTAAISTVNESTNVEPSTFTDEGFQLARAYYDRLILQYPHSQQMQHSAVTAKVIYPALFNVWIYGVQDAARRARKALLQQHEGQHSTATAPRRSSSTSTTSSTGTSGVAPTQGDSHPLPSWPAGSEGSAQMRAILEQELTDAQAIASRLDELMRSPTYDKDAYLRRLQGMVALWRADLHDLIADGLENGEDPVIGDNTYSDQENADDPTRPSMEISQHRADARTLMAAAEQVLEKDDFTRFGVSGKRNATDGSRAHDHSSEKRDGYMTDSSGDDEHRSVESEDDDLV